MRNCRREKKQGRKEKHFEEGVCKKANIYNRLNHIKADVQITTYQGRGEMRKQRRNREEPQSPGLSLDVQKSG